MGNVKLGILSTAAAECLFNQRTKDGRGFTGVKNFGFGAGDGVNKLPRKSSNSAQPLQKVENDALAREQHPRIVTNNRNWLALMQTHTVENFGMAGHFIVRHNSAIEHCVYS